MEGKDITVSLCAWGGGGVEHGFALLNVFSVLSYQMTSKWKPCTVGGILVVCEALSLTLGACLATCFQSLCGRGTSLYLEFFSTPSVLIKNLLTVYEGYVPRL